MFGIWTLIGLFVAYIVTHFGIAYWKKGIEEDTTIEDREKKLKLATHLFKFWAMYYLAFVIVLLYTL